MAESRRLYPVIDFISWSSPNAFGKASEPENHLQRSHMDAPLRDRRHPYRMEEGEIEVDSITPIGLPDITPQLARESGFLGLIDLLKVAQHGKGQNIYLVRFHYLSPS